MALLTLSNEVSTGMANKVIVLFDKNQIFLEGDATFDQKGLLMKLTFIHYDISKNDYKINGIYAQGKYMKLTLNNLNKCYGDKVAVKDISFQVNDGETVGILGPNGAGKTTLFYIIAGLIECDSVKYTADTKINDKSISKRTELGLSYQESSIFRGLTVRENVLAALQQNIYLDKDAINSK